ncbi:energy-coupled thiamine transporter ThiT [Niameybacter massiliensis]|uniref:Energy-coupled thiamine transporter ThiT n=1 Tax=Holtiella tumoricola TaxID=3018743 RepID=A0AA42J066_9FIRM|nr:energy-coupled thiamine transporter ThiT [Holtiella tumoricola]MDA3730921.1 energy-coupled thiamine transporter ThiT [Holtiella tumoricola]
MSDFLSGLQETPSMIWVCLSIFLIVLVLSIIIKTTNKQSVGPKLTTKTLAFGGMCVALSFILSYIKLFEMPQGGSVTLVSMLPVMLFAFVCGPTAGIIAGLAYGFLQFFQGAYAAHWVSILLDYPLAFAWLGLVGIIPKTIKSLQIRFGIGAFIAIIGRFCMHLLSGAIFFGEYAPEGMNPWIYSSVYNAGYLSVEFITTLIIGIIILTTPIYKYLKVSFMPSTTNTL